jgi:hypothetical protein
MRWDGLNLRHNRMRSRASAEAVGNISDRDLGRVQGRCSNLWRGADMQTLGRRQCKNRRRKGESEGERDATNLITRRTN